MKQVLITGRNSYIGNEFFKWIMKESKEINIDFIDVRTDKWMEKKLSNYDVIIHLAGIVHQKKIDDVAYQRINTILTKNIAEKAKKDGVEHFIFMSTMSVYGKNKGLITVDTPVNPKNAYGISKFNAEKELLQMRNTNFKVSIVRPPIVYGKECKGNFDRLRKLSLKFPFIPSYSNKRSMIFVENLSSFLYYLIKNEVEGLFHPRDSEYISTNEIILEFKKINNKKIIFVKTWLNKLLCFNIPIIDKIFGDFIYEDSFNNIPEEIIKSDFKQNLRKIEGLEDYKYE